MNNYYPSADPADAAPPSDQDAAELRALMGACVDATTGRPKFPFARPSNVAEMIAVGSLLCSIKADLGHGEFIRWVESECPFSYRSAHRYMAVARAFSKSDTVADLTSDTKSKS